jgi:hypothetical protein
MRDSPAVAGRLVWAGSLALVLALAGCGGGSGGGGGGSGGDHPLGTRVVVQTTNPGAKTKPTNLAITVKAVRKGAMKDLTSAGYTVDKDARDDTPYYVDVGYENTGKSPIKKQLDVSFEDGDGNLITSTVVFDFGSKPFAKCPRVFEGVLAPGKSYAACTLFLVKPGVTPKRVSFLPSVPGKATDFVYWKAA